MSPDGAISEINLTGAYLLGVERGDLLGKRFQSLVVPKDQDRWSLDLLNIQKEGLQVDTELSLKRGDGTEFPAELQCSLQRDDSGESAARIILSDITVRKGVEERVGKLNEDLEKVIRERTTELRERLKEITCLHEFRRGLTPESSLEEVCQIILKSLVTAMQFPEIAVAMIETARA